MRSSACPGHGDGEYQQHDEHDRDHVHKALPGAAHEGIAITSHALATWCATRGLRHQ